MNELIWIGAYVLFAIGAWLFIMWPLVAFVGWLERRQRNRKLGREMEARFRCPHPGDRLCQKYGCPDDPDWKGDGCSG